MYLMFYDAPLFLRYLIERERVIQIYGTKMTQNPYRKVSLTMSQFQITGDGTNFELTESLLRSEK